MKPKFRLYINENLPRVNYNVIEEEVPLDLSVKRFNPVSIKSPVYLSSHDHPLDLASTDSAHRHHLHATHHLLITNGHHTNHNHHHHHSHLTHLNNHINQHINHHLNHHLNLNHHHHNDRHHHHHLNHHLNHHHLNHSIHLIQSPIQSPIHLDSSSSSPPNSNNLTAKNDNLNIINNKDNHLHQANRTNNYNEEEEEDDDEENENENVKNGNSINLNGDCTDSTEADDHQTSIHSPTSDNCNDSILNGANNNRRTSRPLMGKHVRRGTGASPQILSRLKSILQDKQRLREAGLVPSNWKRKKTAKACN